MILLPIVTTFCKLLCLAVTLRAVNGIERLDPQERSLPTTVPPTDALSAIERPPSRNALIVSCDSRLGAGMNVTSCFNVLRISPVGEVQETWGYPGHLPPGTLIDVRLPVKLFSGKAPHV